MAVPATMPIERSRKFAGRYVAQIEPRECRDQRHGQGRDHRAAQHGDERQAGIEPDHGGEHGAE